MHDNTPQAGRDNGQSPWHWPQPGEDTPHLTWAGWLDLLAGELEGDGSEAGSFAGGLLREAADEARRHALHAPATHAEWLRETGDEARAWLDDPAWDEERWTTSGPVRVAGPPQQDAPGWVPAEQIWYATADRRETEQN